MNRQGAFFVTSLRSAAHFGVVEEHPIPERGRNVRDQIIHLGCPWYLQRRWLRRPELEIPSEDHPLFLSANHLKWGLPSLAGFFGGRWQIEALFHLLKQNSG